MVTLTDQKMTSSARPLMDCDGSRSQLTLGGKNGKNGSNEDCEGSSSGSPHSIAPEHAKMGWIVSAIFIVADMVGGGVVAMPVAFVKTGTAVGILFMVTIASIFLYTAYQLGVVWNIMQERWPQYHEVCRKPFPEIAKRSMGRRAKTFTSLLVNLTLFGICVVYLLLSSSITQFFVDSFAPVGHKPIYCVTIIILAVSLLPVTFLKSPAHFWHVIVVACGTTMLSVFAIMTGMLRDYEGCRPHVEFPKVEATTALASIGTFLFAFSGHYVFPSVQHDMRQPKKFTRAVVLGFSMVVCLYMPLSIIAFEIYGTSMSDSVIYSVQTTWLQYGANIMIAVHCILTLVIVINPINQELEHYLKIAHHFGKGRVILRTAVLAAVVFVAELVPNFIPVMNVVGSSTIPVGCVVMPALFYLYIRAAEEDEWRAHKIPSFMDVIRRTRPAILAVNVFVILSAVIVGAYATWLAIGELTDAKFGISCYESFISGGEVKAGGGGHGFEQRCCGGGRNITTFLDVCPVVLNETHATTVASVVA